MASSPPAARDSSPELLTPNAKLQALLRSVDSSDEEGGPKTTKRKLNYTTGLPRRSSQSPARPQSSDDDSDVEIRPRGRLAARMQGAASSTTDSGSTSAIPESSLPDNARERVRKMLQQEEEAEKAKSDATEDAAEREDDDEDELPVARRRLKRKTSVGSTPSEPTQQEETQFTRSDSPALFVSSPVRPPPSKTIDQNAESDDDLPTTKSDRFQALVQRKRQEREAREAAEEARKAERRAQQEKLASEMEELGSDDGNVSSITDDEGGRQLTQQARPTRKAGKKAIEDMNRETQRMARNMQLAHEAKTRKRITKTSLFERFNFRVGGEPEPKTASSSCPGTPPSDSEMKDADTAPSSPPTARKDAAEDMIQQTPADAQERDDELPSVDELVLQTPTLDKGKGKAVDIEPTSEPAAKPKRRVRVKMPALAGKTALGDSDDELQVTRTTKDKINAVFESVPLNKAKEPHSIQALRALAHVKSPNQDRRRRNEQPSMTNGELQFSLQQKARQQARLERERRVEDLKARGVNIQTAEEQEREKQEVENMLLAQAREEDRRLMQSERAAAKKEAMENGTADPLAWDDSEDEDFVGSEKGGDEADVEQSEIELSGSEEEEEEEDEEKEGNPMLEDEADEETEEAVPETSVVLTDPVPADDEEELPSMNRRRGRNLKAILSDDEDDVVEATPKPQKVTHTSPAVLATDSPAAPGSVIRSAKKTFIPGLPVESGGPAGLGLTQIFAGTMDDSQSQMTPARGPTQSMMPDFDHLPDSNFSARSESRLDKNSPQNEDTQASTQGVKFNLTQSQMRKLDSLLQAPDTQISEMIEPSQDGGFQEHTPLMNRFIEPPTSTVQTVVLDKTGTSTQPVDSPLVQRGRLRRKLDVIQEARDSESPVATATAFSALQDGAEKQRKKAEQEEFDRKKSKAKEMVQEQADESEDEYAGLGGADGEDSDDDDAASVQEMIDDAAGNDKDKAKISAYYAERERIENEQGVEKLFKDVTTGNLRRKRGADYDLSDSDDGGEARRRMKRRHFKKMQDALYKDERVKKMAENPGNQAFLRTIEDQGSDDEMDFLDMTEPVEEEDSTATPPRKEDDDQTVPDSQPRKALGDAAENYRAPANPRRTKNGKKPSDIGEVRQTLSSLLEEGSVIPATQAGSDSEEDEEDVRQSSFRSNKENDSTPNPRRSRAAVVDRMAIKRSNSSNLSMSRVAFSAGAARSTSDVKIPTFLRHASSAASSTFGTSATSSTNATTAAAGAGGGFGDEAKIKKPAGPRGRSGIHGFRASMGQGPESDAMAKIRESDRRRQQKRVRGAERRIGAVGGLLTKGSFE